ncbi:MAG TPA: NAD(+)/NADH kinase [Planctomycetota bacterium]|nr:NAD(+)/NADH kinase [Planctomycetota bacterium]
MSEIRRVLVHWHTAKPESVEAAPDVIDRLRRAGFEVLEPNSGDPDVLILLGGDGFLMESLRHFAYPRYPVFGINFGTVGFLMNSHSCIPSLTDILREGRSLAVSHPLLEAVAHQEDGKTARVYAFNEFVLERQTGQAVRLEIEVNRRLFNRFAGDGFVISTPAGSTAYNLAAGGPAVHPAVQGIVLTPLYPHQAEPFHSVQFSLVLPLESEISVSAEELLKRHVRLVADGHAFPHIARVTIRDSGRRVTLLRTPDREFTRLLSEKFIGARDGA